MNDETASLFRLSWSVRLKEHRTERDLLVHPAEPSAMSTTVFLYAFHNLNSSNTFKLCFSFLSMTGSVDQRCTG